MKTKAKILKKNKKTESPEDLLFRSILEGVEQFNKQSLKTKRNCQCINFCEKAV